MLSTLFLAQIFSKAGSMHDVAVPATLLGVQTPLRTLVSSRFGNFQGSALVWCIAAAGVRYRSNPTTWALC
ncbi:hypothetical protein F5X96DRAFT_621993 [Biscogniauxia mediterranea]|nr:hypothetical protein F5X96DRAFT_621993 [Biscogniauxia mediterranea]